MKARDRILGPAKLMSSSADHRPWPIPDGAWRMAMRWHDLLFMHWPIAPEALRRFIPPALEVDTIDGRAWIGVVPFRMTAVRHRLMPALPWLSAFPELNVRTYVRVGDRPGVWFFSLDARNPLAVAMARRTYRLAYYRARMSATPNEGIIHYHSRRTHRGAPPAEFVGRYRPLGDVFQAVPGSIEHWLTERYCLYAADRAGRLFRAEIAHAPWPLQPGEAELERNSMIEALGISQPPEPPLVHYSRQLDVVAWPLALV